MVRARNESRRWRWRKTLFAVGAAVTIAGVVGLIAFLVYRTDRSDDGFRLTHIIEPAPSPDGNRIAFVAVHERSISAIYEWVANKLGSYPSTISPRLWILDRSGGNVVRTNIEVGYMGNTMTWRPDGSELFATSMSPVGFGGLCRITPDTLAVNDSGGPFCLAPRFSPGGDHLGYVDMGPVLSSPGPLSRKLVIEHLNTGKKAVVPGDVYPFSWLWTHGGSRVTYLNSRITSIHEYRIQEAESRCLYSVPDPINQGIRGLVQSPDGSSLGFHQLDGIGWFHRLNPEDGTTEKLFQCDNTRSEFAWNETGICYLDEIEGGVSDEENLMLYDLQSRSSRVVEQGRFSGLRWLSRTELLAVKDLAELWIFDVETGASEKIFGVDR